jgi:hypothetical protein
MAPEGDPTLRRTGRALLLCGALLHLLFLASLLTHWLDPLFVEAGGRYGQASDFFGIYQAGDNLTRGVSIYSWEGRPEGSDRHVPYFYFYRYLPPTAYVAAAATLVLRPWPAYWIWVGLTEGLLFLLLYSLTRLRASPRGLRELLAGLALGFFPFYLEQWMGQFSFLMAAFLWGVWLPELERAGPPEGPQGEGAGWKSLLRRGEFWCWSGAIALKNYPALFALPYLRQGRWKRVLAAAGLVLLACLPYELAHPQDLRAFLVMNFRPLPPAVLGGSYGLVSLVRELGWRLPKAIAGTRLVLGHADVYVGNLGVLLSTGILVALSLWATWRNGGRGPAAEPMVLWVLTFFLIYKDIWEYHYVMLLPAVWLLALRGPRKWPLVLGALLALPTPYIFYRGQLAGLPVARWPVGIVVLHYGAKAFPTLGLYAVAWRRIVRRAAGGVGAA